MFTERESHVVRTSFDPTRFRERVDVLDIVLDHVTHGIVVVGPDYRVLAFNHHFEKLFQLPAGTVDVGADFREVLTIWAIETGQDAEMLGRAIRNLDETATYEAEFPQLIKGQQRWILLVHNPLPMGGCVRTFTDITQRKTLEVCLLEMTRIDPLTEALNRRSVLDCLGEELERRSRYGHELAVLLMDLDHFKHINDQFGHLVGDEVLRSFVAGCRSSMRASDRIGRFGGEEFIMVLPETGQGEAVLIAERIRRQAEDTVIAAPFEARHAAVTVSIGVATAMEGDTVPSIVKRADLAMYRAKNAGRNSVATDY